MDTQMPDKPPDTVQGTGIGGNSSSDDTDGDQNMNQPRDNRVNIGGILVSSPQSLFAAYFNS